MGARIHAFPSTLSLPSFPPLAPSVAQDWTACQWPELVPTHSHPGPTPLVLVSFSLGFIHLLVLSSLVQGCLSTDPSLFTCQSPYGCISTVSPVHLPLGAFLLISPAFSFHYDNSMCLHLNLTRTRLDISRCSTFPLVFFPLSFSFTLLGFRF